MIAQEQAPNQAVTSKRALPVVVEARYSVPRTSLGARLSGSKLALSVKVRVKYSIPNASIVIVLEGSDLRRPSLSRFHREHIQDYTSEKLVKVP
jgi:hypothetical protein